MVGETTAMMKLAIDLEWLIRVRPGCLARNAGSGKHPRGECPALKEDSAKVCRWDALANDTAKRRMTGGMVGAIPRWLDNSGDGCQLLFFPEWQR